MYKIKMAIIRFMNGRYGNDSLGRAAFVIYFALFIINLFVRSWIIYAFELLTVFLYAFRFLSRNTVKRQSENYKYLQIKSKIKKKFLLIKNRFKYRKTHVYRKCPKCRAVLRFPKRKGEISCTCPKCQSKIRFKVYRR